MFDYALDGKEADDLTGTAKIIYTLVKPNLEANNQRYENGKKGGRPAKKTNGYENEKPMVINSKTNGYENEKPNVNENENVNVDVKEKQEKEKHRHGDHVLLTDKEYQKLCSDFGTDQTETAISFLNDYITEKGYKSKSHNLALRRWVFDAVSEKQRRTQTARSGTKFSNFKDNERNSNDLDALQAAYLRKQDERILAKA